jgi:SAM-dependent methyltransferase
MRTTSVERQSMTLRGLSRSVAMRLAGRLEPTVSQGWDIWARRHIKANPGRPLGDEWNEPAKIGVSVSAEEIVAYLDRTIVEPFLGEQETILEIGPGGGRFTTVLLPRCSRLIAVETSPAMLALMRKRFARSTKVQYILTDGSSLGQTIPDQSVSAVFSYDVFVHLQHWDIYKYLLEIKRVLIPGGKAIIHHANTFSELGWAKFLGDVEPSLGRHKLPWTFSVMTPDLMHQFITRAGLMPQETLTDVVRRDGITLLTS